LQGTARTIAPRRDAAPEETLMKWHEAVGGRKFTLAVLASLQTAALTAFDMIDGGVYQAVMIGTVGAFILGNAAQAIGLQITRTPAAAPEMTQ
jgi:hypothetical protein